MMTKRDYWTNLGFANSYAEHTAKGIRLFMRHIGLSEQDLGGLIKLIEFRNKTKPDMPLDQFVLFLTYLAELNFLSDEAYQGFKKFYNDDEILRDRIELIGKVLAQKENEGDEDPIEWMTTEFLARYYQEKTKNSITVGVDAKLFAEFMSLATEEEGKAFGKQINEKVNNLLKEWHKKVRERAFREKLRKKQS